MRRTEFERNLQTDKTCNLRTEKQLDKTGKERQTGTEKGGQAGKTDRQGHRETDRPDRWSYR